jgi:hypothetical protein
MRQGWIPLAPDPAVRHDDDLVRRGGEDAIMSVERPSGHQEIGLLYRMRVESSYADRKFESISLHRRVSSELGNRLRSERNQFSTVRRRRTAASSFSLSEKKC